MSPLFIVVKLFYATSKVLTLGLLRAKIHKPENCSCFQMTMLEGPSSLLVGLAITCLLQATNKQTNKLKRLNAKYCNLIIPVKKSKYIIEAYIV